MIYDMNKVSNYPWHREGWNVRSYDGSVVAKIQPWNVLGDRQEDQVNANIVTASPLLYEALKYATDLIENKCMPNEKWIEKAKLALLVAEGLK
jgi:hypothetical protein